MELGQALIKPYNNLLKYLDQVKLSRDEIIAALIQANNAGLCRWRECDRENDALKTLIRGFEKEVVSLQGLHQQAKAELIEARSQIASLVATNHTIQSEKQILEEQVNAVRAVLMDTDSLPEKSRKRLEFITEKTVKSTNGRASGLSTTGIDYDKTDDSCDSEKSKDVQADRPVQSEKTPTVKRKRSLSVGQFVSRDPVLLGFEIDVHRKRSKDDTEISQACAPNAGGTAGEQYLQPLPLSRNKSISEPRLAEEFLPEPKPRLAHQDFTKSIPDLTTTPKNPRTPYATDVPSKKKHLFLSKTVLRTEICDACEKKINFGRVLLRCLECKTQVHQECRNNAVMPCVSRTPTSKNAKGKLANYVPPTAPYIPHIVVHLVGEIERRGLNYLGLYRVPGTDSKVKDLLDRFMLDRGVPNVKLVDDVSVLTGCLKKFLQQLKEPLVPYTSRADLIRAVIEETDLKKQSKRVHDVIVELPMPSRDTLAYLVLHLQKVAYHSASNKMPLSNLAKIFGPTVMGGGGTGANSVAEMMDEAGKQEKVMMLLLSLPREYWLQYVDYPGATPIMADRSIASALSTPSNAKIYSLS